MWPLNHWWRLLLLLLVRVILCLVNAAAAARCDEFRHQRRMVLSTAAAAVARRGSRCGWGNEGTVVRGFSSLDRTERRTTVRYAFVISPTTLRKTSHSYTPCSFQRCMPSTLRSNTFECPSTWRIRNTAFLAPTASFATNVTRGDGGVGELPLDQSSDQFAVDTAEPFSLDDEDHMYRQLQSVATQLRYHDAVYYNNNRDGAMPNTTHPNEADVTLATTTSSSSLSSSLSYPPSISDEEYDALAAYEADLCRRYPHLLNKWRKESGYGLQATRYEGRVGMVASATNNDPHDTSVEISAPESPLTDMDMSASSSSSTPNTMDDDDSTTELTATVPRLKRTHAAPMLSLENAHTTTQVLAWLERVQKRLLVVPDYMDDKFLHDPAAVQALALRTLQIVTEPKLDGVSLSLRYELQADGDAAIDHTGQDHRRYTLKWASTRGDGRQGTDVTRAVHEMGSVPIDLRMKQSSLSDPRNPNYPSGLEIRGEVVVPQTVFAQWRKEHADSVATTEDSISRTTLNTTRMFSNARNAASGILQRKEITIHPSQSNVTEKIDSAEVSRQLRSKLRFYAYDLLHLASTGNGSVTCTSSAISDARASLLELGFSVPMPAIATSLKMKSGNSLEGDDVGWTEADISDLLLYHEKLSVHRAMKETVSKTKPKKGALEWGDFDVDGCVHKIMDDEIRTILGHSNRAPRWAVAHKFAPTAVVTELLDIEIQVGRTGALTPVAILKPVNLAGVTVQRATMHNFAHMQEILGGVTRIARNSTVMVRRAGDVIPQVTSLVSSPLPSERLQEPADDSFISLSAPIFCPSCGSDTVSEGNQANKSATPGLTVGKVVRCSGPSLLCPPRVVAALRHAYGSDALDIDGLSEARIQQLMDAGFLRIPSDLYICATDDVKLKEISQLPGWGQKSVDNLAEAANLGILSGVALCRFIYSLGIRSVGARLSDQLASLYVDKESFMEDIDQAAKVFELGEDKDICFSRLTEDSEFTKGIGPNIIAALHEFSTQKALVDAAHKLANVLDVYNDDSMETASRLKMETQTSATKPLSGLSVVFTGSIPKLPRSESQNLAKAMGAKSTPSTISKSTGLLVVSGDRAGKKIEQAEQLGVRIMYADEFLKMVEEFRKPR